MGKNKKNISLPVMMDKCLEISSSIITPKRLFYFLVVLYIASLLPIFRIGCYDYPVADDYTFGAACRSVWVESHSAAAVFVRALKRAWEYYVNWAGCMSSSFFMALQPGVFGESLYKVTPVLMVGIISLGNAYIMHVVFVRLLKCNRYIVHSITALMLFVMIQRMPEPAEGLFWYNGALHYMFMHGISLFFYGLLISAVIKKDRRRKCFTFILAAVPGFIAAMGNYMTALNAGIILALIILALIMGKNLMEQWFIVIPSGIFYVSFILNIIAPGNAVRAADSAGMNPLKSIFASFYYVLDYCVGDWSGWVELVLVVIVATLFWNVSGNIDFDFPYPLLVVFLNYCILAAMITPPLFGTGNIEAGRIKSLIYIMYILILTVTVCYVTAWLRKKWDGKKGAVNTAGAADVSDTNLMGKEGGGENAISPDSKIVIMCCVIFLLVGSVLCIIPDNEYYTCSMAAADILNGNAAAYGEAMQERIRMYNSGAGMDVEVPPLPVRPRLLCTSDISEDGGDWINLGVCRFYGLNSLKVKKDENLMDN